MQAERFIAWKFMLKGSEKGTFSPLTLFAWAALGVGVWAMGTLLSVMYGFEGALKDRVLTAYPHVKVLPAKGALPIEDPTELTQKLGALDSVKEVSPYFEAEMVLQSEYRALGVVVMGLENHELEEKLEVAKEGVPPNPEAETPEIMVGQELARRVGISVGDTIQLISPIESSGLGGMVPKTLPYRVSGTFESGHYEFDQQFLYMSMRDARDLLKVGDVVTGWHIWGADYESAPRVSKEVNAILPSELKAQSWQQFNSALFQSLKLEQFSMFLIFSFAILIAVMNISITLTMNVVYKRKNIGILRAMGAKKSQIKKIFLWQGGWIGIVGLGFGAIATVLSLLYIEYILPLHYQLPDIYYDRSIPIEIRLPSFIGIYGLAILLIFAATWYPAKRAMQTDPIQAIRA